MQGWIVCGQCGTSNPSSHKTCDNCGAMLTGVHLSAPDRLPDWLREPEEAGADLASNNQQGDASASDMEIRPTSTGLELPAWLRSDSTSEADVPAGAGLGPNLPDWLSEVEELPAPPEGGTDETAAAPSSGVPSWLLLENDDSTPSAQGDVPDTADASNSEDRSSEPSWSHETQ